MKRINYGIDAPHVIRNLVMASVIGFLLPIFLPVINIGRVRFDTSGFIPMGIACGLMAVWMILYSVYGKRLHRDRILNMFDWKGTEKVLDVGTGRGLMVIGAAKRLTTGKATGIDIWNIEDLTKNTMDNTLTNAALESVQDKVEIINDNAVHMRFPDQTFDVVISNLCLHNIYNPEDRKKACAEIGRVLKEGGTAILSDFRHMKEYQANFNQDGFQTEMESPNYFLTFPPLAILKIKKM